MVKLYEVYETMNSVYFILDVINGGELLERLRSKGFLASETIQKLMFNLLQALVHIHSKRCMHRDLKPENLLLKKKNNEYDIVIADFGLAACLDDHIIFKRYI